MRSRLCGSPWGCSPACMASLLNLLPPANAANSTRWRVCLQPQASCVTPGLENSLPVLPTWCLDTAGLRSPAVQNIHWVRKHGPGLLLSFLSFRFMFVDFAFCAFRFLSSGDQDTSVSRPIRKADSRLLWGLSLPFVNSCVFDQP